jgi:antimicrobial peptide system SdpB family protein
MSTSVSGLGESIWDWAARNYPWTNVYGLARTLLALGTVLTLASNGSDILFRPASGISQFPVCGDVGMIGVFCLGRRHLEIARWISVLILLVVASGWRPRYTAIFHWWISFSLNASAITLDGGDQITAVLTLLILPIALTDNRKWHWQSIVSNDRFSTTEVLRRTIALTTLVAIRIEVSIVYFHAAVGKLSVADWVNGTVVYYWLADPRVGLANWLGVIAPLLKTPFVVVITWSALLLETALFMALVMPKKVWRYCLLAGVVFHLGIALTMGLISFSIAMCAALVLYLRPFDQNFALSFARNLLRSKGVINPEAVAARKVADVQ